ncbi:hypothetical protein EHM69_11880 [candidate division KSB1 bacterium]|nr:MAG: hypothetical protein EHM69_11880 [candidate division KSB1 bacterium]
MASAEAPLRICIYGDNRGSNPVHRAVLKAAFKRDPRLFVIAGDILKHDYGYKGTPEAVFNDYRAVFATTRNPLELWPATPGPVIITTPGGHDEQFFVDPQSAAAADTAHGHRNIFEGTNELGVKLYDAFVLEEMRMRGQPFTEIGKPLPMSPYGDYLLLIGSGSHRDVALLMLYRTDRWCFRSDQIDWVDSTLAALRVLSPSLPLIAVAHDWTWFQPDVLDDGSIDGANNAVRDASPQLDQRQKRRLHRLMLKYRVDLAVAADRHAYWAGSEGSLLRLNCGAAICTDPDGDPVALDNLWLEYEQTSDSLRVFVHSIDPPVGCGLRQEAAALGTAFAKYRAADSTWRPIQP